MPVLGSTQIYTDPSTKSRRIRPDVNRHIIDGSRHHAHQLSLGLGPLKMKSPQHTRCRVGNIILHKRTDAKVSPAIFIKVPHKDPACILKVLELENQNLRNLCRNGTHTLSIVSRAYLGLELLGFRSKRKAGGTVKTRIQATIGIQTERGVHFGTTDWIKDRTLQFRSPTPLNVHEEVVLKIELPDGGEWVMAEARVIRSAPSVHDETTRCLARIYGLSAAHCERLSHFMAGPKTRPFEASVQRPIPIREPIVSLSRDGRKLTAKWTDPSTFRRDWALHLSRGRLPADGVPPHRRAFMMCIMMPDGFVATFPAEIGEGLRDGWLIRFLVPHNAFARMRAYAETRSAKVV